MSALLAVGLISLILFLGGVVALKEIRKDHVGCLARDSAWIYAGRILEWGAWMNVVALVLLPAASSFEARATLLAGIVILLAGSLFFRQRLKKSPHELR